MIDKRIPKSGHITTLEDRRNKLNPQKNLVSTTEENVVDLGNSGAAVKPTVTGSSPSGGVLSQAESLSPVSVSSPSGGESSSPVTGCSPSAGVVSQAESSSPVTGSSLSGGVASRILAESSSLVTVSSLSGGVASRILVETSSLVTVSSPSGGVLSRAESSYPVTGSSLSGGVAARILAESSSLVTVSSPSGGVLSRAELSFPVTGSSPSGGAVSQILPSESSSVVTCSSCSGLGVVPQGFDSSLSGSVVGGGAWNVGHGTPPQQSLQRDDMDRSQANLNRRNFHNLIWWCRFIFDGILLTCLERYSDQFADSGEKILGVFMCYWATTLVWMKMTAGVHQGFSAIMEWASIILKMTAIIYINILELVGCNDTILFVIKCLLAIGINWLTHMALHQ